MINILVEIGLTIICCYFGYQLFTQKRRKREELFYIKGLCHFAFNAGKRNGIYGAKTEFTFNKYFNDILLVDKKEVINIGKIEGYTSEDNNINI